MGSSVGHTAIGESRLHFVSKHLLFWRYSRHTQNILLSLVCNTSGCDDKVQPAQITGLPYFTRQMTMTPSFGMGFYLPSSLNLARRPHTRLKITFFSCVAILLHMVCTCVALFEFCVAVFCGRSGFPFNLIFFQLEAFSFSFGVTHCIRSTYN